MRDAPSIDIIQACSNAAPPCAPSIRRRCDGEAAAADVRLCEDAYDVCEGADALVIITEWNLFRMLDLARVKSLLRTPVIVDLRNVYKPEPVRAAGFTYVGVGRG